MSLPALFLAAALAQVGSVVEQDGVKVEVFIRSQQYVWRVHNLGADPITHFEVEHRNCYTQYGPPGWLVELSKNEHFFYAKASDPRLAIKPDRYGDFGATVSSHGAALGVVPLKLTTAEGSVIELDVWGPVKMPRRAVLTVIFTLCGVAFVHARIMSRNDRRNRKPA